VNLLASVPAERRRATLLGSMAWTSSINVDWILGEATVDGSPDDDLAAAHDRYVSLRTGTEGEAWLLAGGKTLQPYPVPLSAGARRCGSLLEAMGIAASESPAWPQADEGTHGGPAVRPRSTPDAESLERLLRRRVREMKKRRAALERQLDGESADNLREIGNLLLARKNEVPRGSGQLSLTGFDGLDVEVSLDPRLDAVGNADRFYDRARRRERAARAIPGKVSRTNDRIARLEDALEKLTTSGETEELWELVGGRPDGPRGRRTGDEPLPYRRYRSSGGLEIRVGRSSRGNDALTFRHSAPEDVWLHARQAAGAHVILRWDKRDQNPPIADLTEAAVLAALHSEARHSGVVAVDWTRRKHVRKPRKAAPGAVVPERVATLFVEPDPSVAARLSPDE
jgi:predicted ribosome quality control (RQC) complex YloA/Tae2 family protein